MVRGIPGMPCRCRALAFTLVAAVWLAASPAPATAQVVLDASQAVGPPAAFPGDGLVGAFTAYAGPIASFSDPTLGTAPIGFWAAVVSLINFPDLADVPPFDNDALDFFVKTGSTGNPALGVRDVTPADFLGGTAFLPSSERFTAVLTGFVSLAAAGRYVFVLGHDDGARLFLGATLVIDAGFRTAFREDAGAVDVAAPGVYPIRVDFFENTADANLALSWIPPGGSRQVVPTAVLYSARPVRVDIKPGSLENPINLGAHGTVPVAVLSGPGFDATTVDPATVTLAGAPVARRGRGVPMASVEDVDGDGRPDLVLHVTTAALQLTGGDTEAVLEGRLLDGTAIRGVDSIRIVP
jgi:hypothetical protein